MMIQSIHKGRTVKTVTLADVGDRTDKEIIYFAMIRAGETDSSVFGKRLKRDDYGTVTVRLHTD